MMRRFGLRDDQWERIKDLLPGREGSVGVTAADNRLFVEAVLYRYRTGMPWRDLPERFGDGVQGPPAVQPLGQKRCLGAGVPTSRSRRRQRICEVSRPAGFHRRPLAERCVSLSVHTAPIRQTSRSYRFASARRGPFHPDPAFAESDWPVFCEP